MTGGATVLLERERELAQLGALVDDARAGAGRVVVIEGPAGIGKTSLLAHTRRLADAADLDVLTARGGEVEREFPFAIVRQLFERRVTELPTAAQEELFGGAARLAAPILGIGQHDQQAGADPTFPILHGLHWLCANLATVRPLLLAVDDVHWCDPGSLRWLGYLAPRVEDLRALVVIAARGGEAGPAREQLERLIAGQGVITIRPAPLSEAAAGRVVEAVLGPATPAFIHSCREVTGGNPFMLGELARTLATDGVAPDDAGVPRLRQVAPEAVARAVLTRVGLLDPEARTLVRAVAVLGTQVELVHALALAGLGTDVAATTVEALQDAEVLARGHPLEFVHPIVRAAIYDDLDDVRRGTEHARAAHVLAAAGAPPEAIAAQLLTSLPAGDPWVVEQLRAATATAANRGASDAVARYLRRALEERAPGDGRAELLLDLGTAEVRIADPAAFEHLSDAHRTATDPVVRARAVLALEAALSTGLPRPESDLQLQRVESSLAELPAAEGELALVLKARRLMSTGWGDSSPEELAAEARAAGAAGSELLATVAWFLTCREIHPADELVPLATEALADGALRASMAADASGWLCALFTLAAAGRWEAVARECRAGQDDMRRRGSEFDYVFATNLLSEALHQQGRLLDAEAEARNALEIGARAGVGSWLWLDGARRLGWILLDRGLDREASELVKTARLDEIEFDEPSAHLRLIRGWLAARAGDLVAARDEFLAVGEGVVADGVTNPALCAWRSAAALVLARLDEPERARAIAEAELKLARSVAVPGPLGRALWSTGVVVRGEAGLALLREAVATLDGSEAVLELARARLALGGELRRAGHRRAARDELRAALEVAERSSAEALAEIAREELHVSGARMRRDTLTGLGSLTPSERRVAQLAAEGSSNPEIAQALFVTRKTVETHLGRVYMKLDLRSRDELAAVFAEELTAAS